MLKEDTARNDAAHVDVEDCELPEPRAPKRKTRDANEWAAVGLYMNRLVPSHLRSGRHGPDYLGLDRRGRHRWGPAEWTTRSYPISERELHAGLFRGDKYDLRDVDRVAHITWDIDAHGVAEEVAKVVSLDARRNRVTESIRARMPAAVAARRRRAVAALAAGTVAAILERVPGAVVSQTRGGFHVDALLSEWIAPSRASAIGHAVIMGIEPPAGVSIEVFPRVDTRGKGRTCALPLTGSARIVKRTDYLTRANRRRIDDLVELFDADLLDVDSLLGAVPVQDGTRVPSEPAPIPRPPNRRDDRQLADDGYGLPQVRNRDADGKYTGAYRQQMIRVLTRIENDQSWRAVPKIVAAAFYQSVERVEAEASFESWLSLDHGADHTHTESGRRSLRRIFGVCWKRCERGVRDGWLIPGLMRAPEIRQRFRELADRQQQRMAA